MFLITKYIVYIKLSDNKNKQNDENTTLQKKLRQKQVIERGELSPD
jgi:hypothetical protein